MKKNIIVEMLERKLAKANNLIQQLLAEKYQLQKKISDLKAKLEVYEKESKPADLPPEINSALSRYVEDSALSARVKHICLYNNIRTIGDLAKLGKWDFTKMGNAGPVAVSEVSGFLQSQGLSWNMKM